MRFSEKGSFVQMSFVCTHSPLQQQTNRFAHLNDFYNIRNFVSKVITRTFRHYIYNFGRLTIHVYKLLIVDSLVELKSFSNLHIFGRNNLILSDVSVTFQNIVRRTTSAEGF